MHAVIKVSQALNILHAHGRITKATVNEVTQYLANNQTKATLQPSAPLTTTTPIVSMTYKQRAQLSSNPSAVRILELMDKKKTNLCVSADVTTKAELLNLVDAVGSEIFMLKTHIDIVDDFDQDLIKQLQAKAKKYGFLIFEDRKYADIGNTVSHQFAKGVYKVSSWADVINAHSVPGAGIIDGLKKGDKEGGKSTASGLLLIAEMSSKGALAVGDYTTATVKMAEENDDFVMGFITQHRLSQNPTMIHMTPGVKLQPGTDNLGQQYNTPDSVLLKNGCDVIIVGRGIYGAKDPKSAAQAYRRAGWNAYEQRLRSSKL